jgi:PAS domain S-box-containing protein
MNFRRKIVISQCLFIIGVILLLFPVIMNLKVDRVQTKQLFDLALLGACIFLLIINGVLIMIITHRSMSPIRQIIDAVRKYQEGKGEFLPEIHLTELAQTGEFAQLATTINSLSDQVRRQLEFYTRQKEETEEILESIGEGIIAVDPSARVIFANKSACRMLGLLKEEILKQKLDILDGPYPDILKKCHELIIHSLQTSELAGHTWILREKGTFYYDLNVSPLAHKDGALLVIQDKTSDYRIVGLGKDFIANASHEIKTPITIICGFAETLQDLPNLSNEMLHEITEKIVRTCGRLDKLVHSLLTLTDIEQIKPSNFTKVNLILLIESCLEMIKAVHSEVIVRIHSHLKSAEVFADISLLELAVMNILENAVKYSQGAAEIDISITSSPTVFQVEFRDRGIGISESDLPQIFERFYTVDKARSRKKGGAGLGLSIVRTVVEKHLGKISVSSELGKGSTFTFTLPQKQS